jgi:hypothetical protein
MHMLVTKDLQAEVSGASDRTLVEQEHSHPDVMVAVATEDKASTRVPIYVPSSPQSISPSDRPSKRHRVGGD